MAKIQTQKISFRISKLVKGNPSSTDEVAELDVVDKEHKDAILELLEQTLGNEYVIEVE